MKRPEIKQIIHSYLDLIKEISEPGIKQISFGRGKGHTTALIEYLVYNPDVKTLYIAPPNSGLRNHIRDFALSCPVNPFEKKSKGIGAVNFYVHEHMLLELHYNDITKILEGYGFGLVLLDSYPSTIGVIDSLQKFNTVSVNEV